MINWIALILFLGLYIALLKDEGAIYDFFTDILDWFNTEHKVRRARLVRGESYHGWILLAGMIFYYLFHLDSADRKKTKTSDGRRTNEKVDGKPVSL